MRLAVSLPSLLPRLFKLLQARSASRHPERNLYRHVIPTFADVPAGILRSGGGAEDERQKERDRQTERERERERERENRHDAVDRGRNGRSSLSHPPARDGGS